MERLAKSASLPWVRILLPVLLLAYVASYVVLSRRGMAEVKAAGAQGLYFSVPENTDAWRTWNCGCVTFYYPLIALETWLGTVDGIGCEPLWGLTGGNHTPRADGLDGAVAPTDRSEPETAENAGD